MTIWSIKTLHPKHGKLSRIKVLILQLTINNDYVMQAQDADSKRTTSKRTKERAITDKMLNSVRADSILVDQTTALICASVLTRARY